MASMRAETAFWSLCHTNVRMASCAPSKSCGKFSRWPSKRGHSKMQCRSSPKARCDDHHECTRQAIPVESPCRLGWIWGGGKRGAPRAGGSGNCERTGDSHTFAEKIAGDDFNVSMLICGGVSSHWSDARDVGTRIFPAVTAICSPAIVQSSMQSMLQASETGITQRPVLMHIHMHPGLGMLAGRTMFMLADAVCAIHMVHSFPMKLQARRQKAIMLPKAMLACCTVCKRMMRA